jgi:hypothetical protein
MQVLDLVTLCIFRIPYVSQFVDFKLNEVIPLQHELGLAADEGVRQLVEQTDGDVCDAEKTAAMKVAASKKAEALHKKMSKLVCVANPELTDGWLREVCPLL